MPPTRSLIDSMREDIRHNSSAPDVYHSPVQDLPTDEPPVDLPVASVAAPVRPLKLQPLSLIPGEWGSCIAVCSRYVAAVPGKCLASIDLLSFIDPLPMDRLALHNHRAARDWPAEDTNQLLAVAHRDLHVARRNVADLTKYLDDHAAQLAMYADAGDNTVPLMTVETFPRLTGGVCAVLEDTLH